MARSWTSRSKNWRRSYLVISVSAFRLQRPDPTHRVDVQIVGLGRASGIGQKPYLEQGCSLVRASGGSGGLSHNRTVATARDRPPEDAAEVTLLGLDLFLTLTVADLGHIRAVQL